MTPGKLVGKIHLWLGLLTGLVVLVIGVTGCLYAFIDEIKPFVYKERLLIKVPEDRSYIPLTVLRDSAQEAVGKDYLIQSVEIPNRQDATICFRARKFDKDAFLYHRYNVYYYKIYMNPYSGETVYIENTKWEFFNVVVNMHINLLLGHRIGGLIVGWSVFLFILLLITGCILWWPAKKKEFKRRTWFRWKETTNWKRKNYDLHNIPGLYLLLILLVISLTGMVWAFKWFDVSVQWVANGGKTYEKPAVVLSDTTIFSEKIYLDSIVGISRKKFPDATYYYLGFPQKKENTINVTVDYKSSFRSDLVRYDQHTGTLLQETAFSDKNNGEKLRALNYDIHTGSIIGFPGKVIAFLASLVAASLPVTGFLIWFGRKNKKSKKQKD